MEIIEAVFGELGLQWAPHKKRGPCRAIEFLGFLLLNTDTHQGVALTRARRERLVSEVSAWRRREPHGNHPVYVPPLELAQFLGHLVFCAEAIPSARAYMQSMLRQFKGLEVDWMRGSVRYAHSEWGHVSLSDGFWRDLHWWSSALDCANFTSFAAHDAPVCTIAGSDASDHACGSVVWIDGAREELTLVFTQAERRRPINFRELRGALRVLECWGPRLREHTVVLEIDNSATHHVLKRMRSHVEDMQELVRRVVDLCGRYGIHLRSVHTPGTSLVRPDALSRGASPDAPRHRFNARAFACLEARFGPFSSLLGAEREHPQAPRPPARRLWLHPSFDTVASALRLVADGLHPDPSLCVHGVIVVPWAPEAKVVVSPPPFCLLGVLAARVEALAVKPPW